MERMRLVIGGLLTITALAVSVRTEISARNAVAAFRKSISEGVSANGMRVGYQQETLASRWSIPDGHGTLGAGFALFGLVLIVAPRPREGGLLR